MRPRLIIDLATLPDEGRRFAGELPERLFDLPAGDARPVGPLAYDVHAQRLGGELFLSATLSAPFEFTCVRSLHPFVQTIRVEAVPISLEIGRQAEIDVAEALREEILLQFPANPRCDQADEPGDCTFDPRYLAVDNPPGHGVDSAPDPPGDQRWAALDAWSERSDPER